MNKGLTFFVFFLIPAINLYSQIYFSQQIIINYTSGSGAVSVYAADLDGDGDKDVLSASRFNDKIAWYKNLDGKGTFGPLQLITSAADWPTSVYAADLDGDGDMDVLSASLNDDKIAWYKNIDGKGTFDTLRVISLTADAAESVYASDLDGDGDMDVLSASIYDDKIAWYKNMDGKGTFGTQQVITTQTDAPYSVYASDIDGDGDMDVLSASYADNKIAWFKNTDGKGTFSTQQVISVLADKAVSVYASDLDGDGDMDVLSASIADDKIAWYENTDGKGTFGKQQVITSETDAPQSVYAADLDGDGDKDVLSASHSDNKIAWYENINGKGTFGPQKVITIEASGPISILASDLDGDGDMDVLSASSDDKIGWFRNREKIKWDEMFVEHLIYDDFKSVTSVYAADIDGDSDQDVLGTSNYYSDIAWLENLDVGSGSFYKHRIDTNFNGAYIVYSADIDGDKDMDVLGGTSSGKEIAWWENTGSNTFTKHTVDGDFKSSVSVLAVDMDHDGDLDILGASYSESDIAWWKNDGSGNFTKYIIDASFFSVSSVYANDIDGDHDMDVAGIGSSQIAWWENDGAQKFTKHNIAGNLHFGHCVLAKDLDSDGDVDLLSADISGNEIAMWENNGLQSFKKDTIDAEIVNPDWIYATDMDNDHDEDILAVSSSSTDGQVCLYENLGSRKFYKLIVRHHYYGANSVHAADLDNDGDKDIIGSAVYSKNVFWWENKLVNNPNPIASDIIVSPDTLFFFIRPGDQKNENDLVCTIKNIGNATLYVQDISCQKDWITDIDTLNFLVKQGKEQQVTIKCSAGDLYNGMYNGSLEIHSNDPGTSVFVLPLVLEMRNGKDVNFVSEAEPNNKETEAQRLSGPSPVGVKGEVSVSDVGNITLSDFSDIEDLYVFTTQSAGIKMKLYDLSADVDIVLIQIVGNTWYTWASIHRGSNANEVFEKADLEPGTYYIGVSIYDTNPIQNSSSYTLILEGNLITGVKEYTNLRTQEFSLGQNYPNPFNPFTKIDFQVQKPSRITITIYDTIGREVRTLIDNFYQTGNYNATWDGSDNNGQKVNAGVYFYCMKSIDFKEVKKALLLK
jgi:hypothetical protein